VKITAIVNLLFFIGFLIAEMPNYIAKGYEHIPLMSTLNYLTWMFSFIILFIYYNNKNKQVRIIEIFIGLANITCVILEIRTFLKPGAFDRLAFYVIEFIVAFLFVLNAILLLRLKNSLIKSILFKYSKEEQEERCVSAKLNRRKIDVLTGILNIILYIYILCAVIFAREFPNNIPVGFIVFAYVFIPFIILVTPAFLLLFAYKSGRGLFHVLVGLVDAIFAVGLLIFFIGGQDVLVTTKEHVQWALLTFLTVINSTLLMTKKPRRGVDFL
jgi:hypothetical protein